MFLFDKNKLRSLIGFVFFGTATLLLAFYISFELPLHSNDNVIKDYMNNKYIVTIKGTHPNDSTFIPTDTIITKKK